MFSVVPDVRVSRPLLALALALALVLVACAPAAAQTLPEPRTWTVTPFLHSSMGIGDPAPDDSVGLGVAVAYDWTSRLSFEGDIGHLFDIAGDTPDIDWSVTTFSGNAVYRFDTRHVTPYATLGLGLERSSESLKTDSAAQFVDYSATEFALNFGGGVYKEINGRWKVRADLRRFQANDLAPDFWRLYAGLTWRLR